MNRLGTNELRRIYRQLNATLTPKQRQLLAVGAARPEIFTPAQLELLKQAEPFLEGLTPEQARQLGMLDTFSEGYEAGHEAGNTIGVMLFVGGIIVALAIIVSLLR